VDAVEEPRQQDSDATSIASQDEPPDALAEDCELCLAGVVLRESTLANSPMLLYVQMVVRLIEGIELSLGELVQLLRRALRQHSMAHRSRKDYVLGFLQQHPP
jgi:hypothetical protein